AQKGLEGTLGVVDPGVDHLAVAAARLLPVGLVPVEQQDALEVPRELFGDGQADHARTDDGDVEMVLVHSGYVKAIHPKFKSKGDSGRRTVPRVLPDCRHAGTPGRRSPRRPGSFLAARRLGRDLARRVDGVCLVAASMDG